MSSSKFATALSLVAAATTFFGSAANARSCHHKSTNQTAFRQQFRIDRGLANGSLTHREAHRLMKDEARLRRQEARFRASNGRLSLAERTRLNAEQDRLSRQIYRERHDGQFR